MGFGCASSEIQVYFLICIIVFILINIPKRVIWYHLKNVLLICLLFFASVKFEQIYSQCPGSATCENAYVFCWEELDGFSCTTAQLGDETCRGNCWAGGGAGKPKSRDWWAFMSPGGSVSITLFVGACTGWPFLTMGIWGGCNCVDEIFCQWLHIPSGSSYTYQLDLEPCKVYYLMLDGGFPAGGCDFSFQTTGTGSCEKISGKPRTVCYGYQWNTQTIYSSGIYKEKFKLNPNSCPIDSVVEFKIIPPSEPADVFYITCDNVPFVDIFGRSYTPCKDHLQINLPKSTKSFYCDSSIILTAINVDFAPEWNAECFSGMVRISPNIYITNACNVGETYEFEYTWFKLNDPSHTVISKEEHLFVKDTNEVYCLELNVTVRLGTTQMTCTKTFCESIREGDFTRLIGSLIKSYYRIIGPFMEAPLFRSRILRVCK
jgi:hypothetical protein